MINKQTTLDLNGPILSFTTHPTSAAVTNAGTVTFIGIATATFPTQTPTNPVTNTGSISYQWYDQSGIISDGTNVSGAGTTTLILSNVINPTDNNRQFYVKADYTPSAYQSSSPVIAGTARSTGNAVNDTLNSNIATLTVYPQISISSQPSNVTVSENSSATFSVVASASDGSSLSYQWYVNGSPVSNGSNVSGATTNTLTISSSNVSSNNVYVVVSHPTAGNSPLTSNVVTWTVVSARRIVNFEFLGSSSTAGLLSWNLTTQGPYSVTSSQFVSFYSPERDIDLILDLYAASGASNGSYRGGEGGVSSILFTARQNEEYVISPLPQANSGGAVYVYRKATLIAVCGSGGSAGSGGNGGDGGGVNVTGADGSGRDAGRGGVLISAGSLPSNGVFGSTVAGIPLLPGDSYASVPFGGRVLPCAKGGYWYNQGKSACQDLGNIQFYLADGILVTNTAVISRGHKAGYGIRQTAGAGTGGGGNGGQGATGGNGGNNGGGGGGGSGYTDGSVTILSTRQGGNVGGARVVIRNA